MESAIGAAVTVTLAIGTLKGAYIARSDDRATWELEGPIFKGWEVNTFGRSPGGDYLLTTSSSWYGAAIQRSADLKTWDQVVEGPAYESQGERKLLQVWTLHQAGDALFAGVAHAGMFRSDDDAATWQPVTGLNDHPTRPGWQPGFGGLAAHRILSDPKDPTRLWCGISAVGVFRSDDGGSTWNLKNDGVIGAAPNEEFPGIGFCVHCLVQDPEDAMTIWRQDHMGVYRTTDGGEHWEQIQDGLPAAQGFGFPIVRDHATGTLFTIPLESDENRLPVDGNLRVYRSTNRGDTWAVSGSGLPEAPTFTGVLRDAMVADQLDPGGVYFGTTAGKVYQTADVGDTWRELPFTFPRITSVKVWMD